MKLHRRALLLSCCLILNVLATDPAAAASAQSERIVLAGGCFWGMQAVFESLRGVTRVVAGYSGGNSATAHYEIVSTGMTGHAESVEIDYDPAQLSTKQLLTVYFRIAHDPTEINRQGPDEGTQYRSQIFYTNATQQATALSLIHELEAAKIFPQPIATKLAPLAAFYPAEEYHQDYLVHHPDSPYIVANDLPKLAALKSRYPQLIKSGDSPATVK